MITASLALAATGVSSHKLPSLDWPNSISGFNVAGLDNYIAAAAIICFAVTLSTHCRLAAVAAIAAVCISEVVSAYISTATWQTRLGYTGQATLSLALVLLANKQFSKVASIGH